MLTVSDVRDAVARIAEIAAGHDAQAHIMQDKLWLEVLKAVAAGHPDAIDLAREAIRTEEIEFDR